LALIQLYKWTLSPLIGRECRYLPTCSSYAADAIGVHGAWAGSWMAGARLCRCHPLGGSGWDPAPKETSGRWWKPWTYGDWRGGVRLAEEACAHDAHISTAGDLPNVKPQ
jgi:putative membrane protein insertion efficiency factor